MANKTLNKFGFSGRISAYDYTACVAFILLVRLVLAILGVLFPTLHWLGRSDYLLLVVAFLVGRRMRDFGWSPWPGILGVVLISFVMPFTAALIWPLTPPVTPETAVPLGVGLGTFALLLALIVAVGLKKGDPGPNRHGDAPSDHFRLWRHRPVEAGAVVSRPPLGWPLSLALDIYIWIVAGLYAAFALFEVGGLLIVMHRSVSDGAFVVLCMPLLLIVPALFVRLRSKRRILPALLLLPVLAFGIYLAVYVTQGIAEHAGQGSSSSSSGIG